MRRARQLVLAFPSSLSQRHQIVYLLLLMIRLRTARAAASFDGLIRLVLPLFPLLALELQQAAVFGLALLLVCDAAGRERSRLLPPSILQWPGSLVVLWRWYILTLLTGRFFDLSYRDKGGLEPLAYELACRV